MFAPVLPLRQNVRCDFVEWRLFGPVPIVRSRGREGLAGRPAFPGVNAPHVPESGQVVQQGSASALCAGPLVLEFHHA